MDICAVVTYRIGASRQQPTTSDSRTELDSHADTCVVGRNALIFHDFERPVNVTGYDPALGINKDVKTVSAAIAYDDPTTGEVIILVLHQALHIPTMEHNLLCPMQLRMNDVMVSEIPKFLTENPTDRTHALTIPTTTGDVYRIALSIHGVTSYFPTRRPSTNEFEHATSRYDLTYELPDWDPTDPT